MKNKTTEAPLPPELEQLATKVEAFDTLTAEIQKLRAFQTGVRSEVDAFAASGDVLDLGAVNAMAGKQLQATLIDGRIATLERQHEALENELSELATGPATKAVVAQLETLKLAQIESAAREMERHFPTIVEARRQAMKAKAAVEVGNRIFTVKNFHTNLEARELAKRLLALFPEVEKEVAAARNALGGSIPSAADIYAA
jgi:hypothetical protein